MSQEAHIMSMLNPEERRRARRHRLNRAAKIKSGAGLLPRDCLITDISDSGVRLHAEGYEVPDEFVLLFSDHSVLGRDRAYRVVWRLGYEVGAEFVGLVDDER
jgi:PilZ domain